VLYKIPRPAACGFLLSEPPQRGRESPGGGGCVGGERRTRRDRERERERVGKEGGGGRGEGGQEACAYYSYNGVGGVVTRRRHSQHTPCGRKLELVSADRSSSRKLSQCSLQGIIITPYG